MIKTFLLAESFPVSPSSSRNWTWRPCLRWTRLKNNYGLQQEFFFKFCQQEITIDKLELFRIKLRVERQDNHCAWPNTTGGCFHHIGSFYQNFFFKFFDGVLDFSWFNFWHWSYLKETQMFQGVDDLQGARLYQRPTGGVCDWDISKSPRSIFDLCFSLSSSRYQIDIAQQRTKTLTLTLTKNHIDSVNKLMNFEMFKEWRAGELRWGGEGRGAHCGRQDGTLVQGWASASVLFWDKCEHW